MLSTRSTSVNPEILFLSGLRLYASVVFFVRDAFTRVPDGIKQIRLVLADAAPIILQFLTSALDARLRLAVLP